MHKHELVDCLKSKLLKIAGSVNKHNNHQWWKGQRAFANFLIHYLEHLDIPSDKKYDFWRIEHYLPELMEDAFEKLRTDTDEATVRFHKEYEEETEHEVPNIIDLGASSLLDQGYVVQTTLGFMLKEVTGQDWVEHKIDTYCNAQKYVLQQTFDKFLRLVYRRGLNELVDKSNVRGMSGKFGETQLRTYIIAGRIMFTFARRKKGETGVFLGGILVETVPYQEFSVSFVGGDDDPLGLSAGLNSVDTDLRTCLEMIEDVIKN